MPRIPFRTKITYKGNKDKCHKQTHQGDRETNQQVTGSHIQA